MEKLLKFTGCDERSRRNRITGDLCRTSVRHAPRMRHASRPDMRHRIKANENRLRNPKKNGKFTKRSLHEAKRTEPSFSPPYRNGMQHALHVTRLPVNYFYHLSLRTICHYLSFVKFRHCFEDVSLLALFVEIYCFYSDR